MNKLFTCFFIAVFIVSAKAQTQTAQQGTQPYGKVDMADLEMTFCDFEKDANAEILFDKGMVYFDQNYNLIFERHIRLKIFKDNAKDEANVRIEYYGGNQAEYLSGVQGETINLNNGNIEIIKVDKKLIYKQTIDKQRNAMVFSFPNVQKGSVIEYKYTVTAASVADFPDWCFQSHVPTRYSELTTSIPNILYYKNLVMTNRPLIKNSSEVKAMANIPSLPDEPFMTSRRDNYQRILYQLSSINAGAASQTISDTWEKVGENEMGYDDFGGQLNKKLAGEEDIINKAKSLKSADDKISYIFNEVKNNMKWNEVDERYADEGTAKAWEKKTGNSTEVNLILYHLLHKAGLKAYPMMVSTRDHGRINPAYTSKYQFNKTVAYVPLENDKYYILDATSKYNIYNEIPKNLLNGYGFYMDKENKKYDLLPLVKTTPAREVTLINAEIKPDGKMNGTAQVNSFSYYRINAMQKYKTDGEKKYIDALCGGDNSLKVSSVKFENREVDTLPLRQDFDFNHDLTDSDENYIYFKPNLFSTVFNYPFLSENRFTDIDFGCQNTSMLSGNYKLPAGYKIDAMPKSISMSMPDNSITFKRVVGVQEGSLVIRYTLNFTKSIYFKENYASIRDFFKKLNEMINEQVVLKKS
ncbi:MAG: hypothetical protein NVSMB24_09770 [Mucilaginibacter sp.]